MAGAKHFSSIDEQLRFAIENRRLLRLRYRGSLRVVEPHDYGVRKDEIRLLTYQHASGGSRVEGAVGWRLLFVAGISDCVVLEQTFRGSRGDAHQHHHTWDVVYARVK